MATKERIYIDAQYVKLADRMVRRVIPGSESTEGVFRDTREFVCFAAGYGFRKGRFEPISSNGREVKLSAIHGIDLGGQLIVEAIAIAHTEDIDVLHPDRAQERAEVFEGYVNGGLSLILGHSNEDESSGEVIASIIKSEYAPADSKKEAYDLVSKKL